ncbi:MAG TPA: hypothetical protein VMT30_03470 [Candidatus Saccharimonadia bacterium]|nr:hypothetical protein [Candidatus Saccharimonadia bacterium]
MSTKTPNPLHRYQVFFAALGVVCAAAIAFNLVVRQGPVRDATTESDIRAISQAIGAGTPVAVVLPARLTDVTGLSAATQKRLGDYQYTVTSPSSYQICATFAAAAQGREGQYYPLGTGDDPGTHGQGRQCFRYTVSNFGINLPGQKLPLGR